MHTILEEAAKSFWKEIAKDVVKRSISATIVEGTRARWQLWKDLKNKDKSREMTLAQRQEDLDWELNKRSVLRAQKLEFEKEDELRNQKKAKAKSKPKLKKKPAPEDNT